MLRNPCTECIFEDNNYYGFSVPFLSLKGFSRKHPKIPDCTCEMSLVLLSYGKNKPCSLVGRARYLKAYMHVISVRRNVAPDDKIAACCHIDIVSRLELQGWAVLFRAAKQQADTEYPARLPVLEYSFWIGWWCCDPAHAAPQANRWSAGFLGSMLQAHGWISACAYTHTPWFSAESSVNTRFSQVGSTPHTVCCNPSFPWRRWAVSPVHSSRCLLRSPAAWPVEIHSSLLYNLSAACLFSW